MSRGWPVWHCPVHHRFLSCEDNQLCCPEGDSFTVLNGVPRFVLGSTYADHFGAQWNRYRHTQLDSYTGMPLTRDRLRRCLGEPLWQDLADKQVLECGCGAGRFTEILLEQGASLTSIDLSHAVDANVETFPIGPAHRVAQADIMQLPFPRQSFDVVLCLGVIQHTAVPEKAIACLADQVTPGGVLVIDHYAYNIRWYATLAPLFRFVFKRLSPEMSLVLIEHMGHWLLPLHKMASRARITNAILGLLSPMLTYYRMYPELPASLQREFALLDTHDSLTDFYKHFRTRNQIQHVLEELGLESIWCEFGGNGIEARAVRPTGGAR
jgi:2-polyprenyl-3-methyl-5-hydroxy-6-metoxy-1,4-benzoquinol methylase